MEDGIITASSDPNFVAAIASSWCLKTGDGDFRCWAVWITQWITDHFSDPLIYTHMCHGQGCRYIWDGHPTWKIGNPYFMGPYRPLLSGWFFPSPIIWKCHGSWSTRLHTILAELRAEVFGGTLRSKTKLPCRICGKEYAQWLFLVPIKGGR